MHKGNPEVWLQPICRSALRRWVVRKVLRPLYPLKTADSHCADGWMSLETGLDGKGKLAPTGIRSPDRGSQSRVAIPTTRSRPRLMYVPRQNYAFLNRAICFDNKFSQVTLTAALRTANLMF